MAEQRHAMSRSHPKGPKLPTYPSSPFTRHLQQRCLAATNLPGLIETRWSVTNRLTIRLLVDQSAPIIQPPTTLSVALWATHRHAPSRPLKLPATPFKQVPEQDNLNVVVNLLLAAPANGTTSALNNFFGLSLPAEPHDLIPKRVRQHHAFSTSREAVLELN